MSVLSSKKISNYTYAIETGDFLVNTDVAKKLGGNNFAPDPHQYLEVALAGCTVITVEMYAKRKKIPLESVDVTIDIIEEGEVNKMKRSIKFTGELTEEERASLIQIAEKCPIHRFLTRGAQIITEENLD